MKRIIFNIKEWLKKFFSSKRNIITVAAIALIIAIVIIVSILLKKDEEKKFSLNSIYDLHPEVVRELYSNVVEVSCSGDMHLDIQLDGGKVQTNTISKNNLIDYLFSHLDKKELLDKEFELSIINQKAKELFDGDINLESLINEYQYNNYIYSIKDDKVVREEKTCSSDVKYVSYLYGYSYNEKEASMDVNIGYLKGDTLYDLSDNKLGKYDGDATELRELFAKSSFYRYNYVKDGDLYKLSSVEWNNKS
ncbi:MAG: hypothetical protein IJZ79_04155 [Bacilli bacterium]|nr:hypothetical protein [Bacilli bacterium]